ncbi:MAG: DUF4272 domain-containing protein [Planctomycetota bacterium]|nr:MAG: DUF4272 domain-containing protein [Planctomycetota bacterium]
MLGRKRLWRKRARLVIDHDPDFYQRPDWPAYLSGMANYVTGFRGSPWAVEIQRVVSSFRFSLAFPENDIGVLINDESRSWVLALCQYLDGVIFTPSMLLDAHGQVLASAGGEYDVDAVLPDFPGSATDMEQINAYDDGLDPETRLQPPTADRVARRAIVLAALSNRGLVENEIDTHDSPRETCEAMIDWLHACGVVEEVEPDEWEVLQRPPGKLDQQAAIDAVWRLEGLGVLLWALGLYEPPPYDELVTPMELFGIVGMFDADAARDIIASVRLRSADELAAYQNHVTMAHWRLRDYSLRPEPMDFVAFSKDCWIGTFDISRFRIENNDMMVGDAAIAEADPGDVVICQSIASERHLAINWIAGYSDIYSETDTST